MYLGSLWLHFKGDEDFLYTDKQLTFAVNFGIEKCVHIPILNDLCLENSESFSVSISSDMSCVAIDPSANTVQVTITDDDGELD